MNDTSEPAATPAPEKKKVKIKIPWDKVLWLLTHAGAILRFIEIARTIKIKDGISVEELGTLGKGIADLNDALDGSEGVA